LSIQKEASPKSVIIRIYSFSHLTIQEYYTAKYIVEHIHKGTLKRLINDHFSDENWREVFLLTAEMMDDADEFFEMFLRALDGFAGDDERLQRLLSKAKEEAGELNMEKVEVHEKRSAVVRSILDIAFFLSTLAIARDLAIALAHDHDHYLARDFYKNALELSKQKRLTELHDELMDLSFPSKEASSDEWNSFGDALFNIFCKYFRWCCRNGDNFLFYISNINTLNIVISPLLQHYHISILKTMNSQKKKNAILSDIRMQQNSSLTASKWPMSQIGKASRSDC